MAHIAIDDILDRANGSIYQLVNLASLRALELAEGAPKLIESNAIKPTTLALEEIAAGKINCTVAKKKE